MKVTLKEHINKSSLLTAAIQGGAPLLTFLSHILLTWWLSPDDYGLYVLIFSWVTVLAIISTFGWDDLLIRQGASQSGNRRFYYGTTGISFILGTAAAAICWLFFLYADTYDTHQLLVIGIGLLSIPFLSSTQMLSAVLRGHNRIYQSQLAEKFIRPLSFIVLISLGTLLLNFSALQAVSAATIALALAFIFNLLTSYKVAENHTTDKFKIQHLFVGGVFFVLLNSVSVLNSRVDILMLGWLGTLEDVGTYNIAVRLSDILGFSLVLAYTLYAPKVAAYYKNNETKKLQELCTFSARAISLASAPIFIVYLFFGQEILSLFGASYTAGYHSMLMVSFAQLISCFTGLAGTILLMTNGERLAFQAQLTALVINTVSNFILIPLYGSEGAAFSTMISIIIWNVLMWYFSKKHAKVNTSLA